MNALRSMLRNFVNVPTNPKLVKDPNALMNIRKGTVPNVLKMMRYQDSFERTPSKTLNRTIVTRGWGPKLAAMSHVPRTTLNAPHAGGMHSFRDGFSGGNKASIDLSGGLKKAVPQVSASVLPAKAAPSGGFFASLEDLAGV